MWKEQGTHAPQDLAHHWVLSLESPQLYVIVGQQGILGRAVQSHAIRTASGDSRPPSKEHCPWQGCQGRCILLSQAVCRGRCTLCPSDHVLGWNRLGACRTKPSMCKCRCLDASWTHGLWGCCSMWGWCGREELDQFEERHASSVQVLCALGVQVKQIHERQPGPVQALCASV